MFQNTGLGTIQKRLVSMPNLVFFSGPTGFTKTFVEKLELPAIQIPQKIKEAEVFEVENEFVLFVPTYELEIVRGPRKGQMSYLPRQVASFLNIPENRGKLAGVVGMGNRNFHEDFARSADEISDKTGVPVLYRVELAGTPSDVEIVKTGLDKFWQNHQRT